MGKFSTRKKFIVATFLLVFFQSVIYTTPAFSVGAYPFPRDIVQPDGSVLTIQQHGDEWYNWITTRDGYRILRTENGFFEYAAQLKSGLIVSSGIKATNPNQRSISEQNFLSSTPKNIGVSRKDILKKRAEKFASPLKSGTMETFFPSSGSPNLLVLLVNFSDTSPTYPRTTFDDFMNLPDYNGSGSFKDYYEEVSKGKLSINTTVYDWVTVPGTHDYYGPEAKWKEFALHAIEAAADAGIDFSKYDNDGDGLVEGISIIHQGTGQELTGNENDIWSHSHSFSAAGIGASQRTFNGVVIDQYTIQPELRSVSGDINTIGVICHEFGHNLGLPDFYDIDDETNGFFDGTGRWDIMAGGTYNGAPAGSSPAHHNPFSKAELGWVKVETIQDPANITLEPVSTSASVLRVNSPVASEYLLIENRQKTGFDAFLYESGMLIYHADEDFINQRRPSNTINIDEHQGFYPIAANHIVNAASCPFPGTANVTELTDTSDPGMTTWDGTGFNRSITNILHSNGTITFDFMAFQDGSPIEFDAVATNEKSISVSWTPGTLNNTELPVLLAWNNTNTFGTPVNGAGYNPGDAIEGGGTVLYYGNSLQQFLHDNLSSSTRYFYSIWSDKGTSYSNSMKAEAVTSPDPVSSFPWVEDFENGLGNWLQEYITGTLNWTNDTLNNGEAIIPAFSGNVYASFYQESYSSKTTRLISPVFNLESGQSYGLRFRHLQPLWETDQDELKVLIRPISTGTWETLAHYTGDIPEWTARILEIPVSEPCQIAFEATSNYGHGVGIDFVEIFNTTPCQTKPELPVTNIATSSITKTSMNISYSRGDGDALLVLARKDLPIVDLPVDGTNYTASTTFGSGTNIGSNTYVVYNGTGNEFSLSGLEHTTDYHLAFYEYSSADNCYQLNPALATISTAPNIYNLSFFITDIDTNPIENAMVIFEQDTIFTGTDGKVTTQVIHSTLYTHVDVQSEGFHSKSTRFLPDNTKTVQLNLRPFDPLGPDNPISVTDYKNIELTWNPVINENFEIYQPYSTSIGGWEFMDKDQDATYGIHSIVWPHEGEALAFMILDVYDEEILQMEYDISAWSGNKVLAAFAARSVPSDDWLISPQIEVTEGDYFSFMARSLANNGWGFETIDVKIRPAGQSTWETLYQNYEVPVSWTRLEYDLSSYLGQKVELAIQNKGEDTFVLLLDDLRVGSQLGDLNTDPFPGAPPVTNIRKTARNETTFPTKYQKNISRRYATGSPTFYSGNVEYAIYRDNLEIGRTYGFSNNTYNDQVPDLGDYEYKVRAVYPDVNMQSAFSETIWVESGYSISFTIKDKNGMLLEGAKITFNNETKTTDASGSVTFTKVPQATDMEYTVAALEYNDFKDTLDANSNKSIEISMSVASSSISEKHDNKVTLSPNPVEATATIRHLPIGIVEISIYDLTGKLIDNKTTSGGKPVEWDFSHYKTGIYMMIIQSDQGEAHRIKIIKKGD